MKGFYPITLSFTKTIFIYLFKLIYPAHLSAYIQNPMSFSITEPAVISSIFGVAFLIFLIVWLKNDGLACLFDTFYLVTLLPLSNFYSYLRTMGYGLCHGRKVFIYPFSWFLRHNIGIIGQCLENLQALIPDIGVFHYFTVHCALNLLFRSNAFKKSGLD